jgi:protein-serine/threonine kinase
MESWLDDLADDLQSLSFTSMADINCNTSSSSDATLTASSSPLATTAKPHTPSYDPCWSAIHRIQSESPAHLLALPDLQFAVHLGFGDIGSVYLAQLKSFDGCLFTAKVIDKKELASQSKEGRARTPLCVLVSCWYRCRTRGQRWWTKGVFRWGCRSPPWWPF